MAHCQEQPCCSGHWFSARPAHAAAVPVHAPAAEQPSTQVFWFRVAHAVGVPVHDPFGPPPVHEQPINDATWQASCEV